MALLVLGSLVALLGANSATSSLGLSSFTLPQTNMEPEKEAFQEDSSL